MTRSRYQAVTTLENQVVQKHRYQTIIRAETQTTQQQQVGVGWCAYAQTLGCGGLNQRGKRGQYWRQGNRHEEEQRVKNRRQGR
jgi:hypothetical protein